MGLIYKRRAISGSGITGENIFRNTNISMNAGTGTIEKRDDGILFTSEDYASWSLHIQSIGDSANFKSYNDLNGHKLKLDAEIEWIDTSRDRARIAISLGWFTGTDSRAFRLKYRDNTSDLNNNFKTHLTDTFICNYEAFDGGSASEQQLSSTWFCYRIYLNSPNGGSCLLKRFNVYDLGAEE